MVFTALGQVRGGLETFENEQNALSWGIYDFSDEVFYEPEWDLFEAGDPDVFTIVSPNSGVSILADADSSDAALVGDYTAQKIRGMGCEAFVEHPSGTSFAEFYFVSNDVFYYSIEFSGEDYFESGGWELMNVDFQSDPWYLIEDDEYVEVEITPEILAIVSEIGLNFFTNSTRSEEMLVAIDDFYLVPEVIIPEPTARISGDRFELAFMLAEGQEYDVRKSVDLKAWSDLTGSMGIVGEGAFTVSEEIDGAVFYQVETDFLFTVLPDV